KIESHARAETSTTSMCANVLPRSFQNRYRCGKIRDSVAEKASQTPEVELPAEGAERTVVDGRMDPEQETLANGPRRGTIRRATAPIPAPAAPQRLLDAGDTSPQTSPTQEAPPDPRLLELSSGDMIEERSHQSQVEDSEVEEPATIPADRSIST